MTLLLLENRGNGFCHPAHILTHQALSRVWTMGSQQVASSFTDLYDARNCLLSAEGLVQNSSLWLLLGRRFTVLDQGVLCNRKPKRLDVSTSSKVAYALGLGFGSRI